MKRMFIILIGLLYVVFTNAVAAEQPEQAKQMDATGQLLFGRKFEDVCCFHEGYAGIRQDGKWGFINSSGKLVVPCVYDYVGLFHERDKACRTV